MDTPDITLADLCIVACSEAFRDNGEIIATGVGPIPRLAAGLAKLTHSPELMMTDGEAYLVEQPVPLGPRKYEGRKKAGYLPFSRFFDSAVWTGRRHAMVTPTQIDRDKGQRLVHGDKAVRRADEGFRRRGDRE